MNISWSIELRSPRDRAEYERLRAVLTRTLGLTWRGMAGEPDGDEIATDCADALWAAGFRHLPTATPATAHDERTADE